MKIIRLGTLLSIDITVNKHWISSCSLWSQRPLCPFFHWIKKFMQFEPTVDHDTRVALSPYTAGLREG